MTDMTKHFLPDWHNFGEITSRIEEHLTVPVKRVPKVLQWVESDPPFYVFSCSWAHYNSQGPLTQEKFDEDLAGAIKDFTNELNASGKFNAYPITHSPPTTYGIAYHDWIGAVYPFDIRAVISLDSDIPTPDGDVEAGLKFHLTTLLAKEDYDGAGK